MPTFPSRALTFAGLLLSVTSTLAAETAAPKPAETAPAEVVPNYSESTLTGDWGGGRRRLAKNGFVFDGLLRYDQLRNRGGQSQGTRGVSHVDLKLKADLDAAWGLSGTTAMLNVLSDAGVGPNARHTGSLMGVTNVEVNAPTTTRLFQAWIQKSFMDERVAVLAGIYPIDSEFFAMDSAAVFLSPQYGTPADLALTRGPSIFNNAAFGFRTKLQSTDKSIYAMWALMDGIPNDPARPKRTAIRFAKGDGAFNIAEMGWLPEAATDKFEGHAKLAVGVWGYTARVNDLVNLDRAGNPEQRRSRGGYLLGERTLTYLGGDKGRYISAFARFTSTDGDSSAIKQSTNAGLHVHGPVASRPDDIIGFAYTRAGLSDKWRTSQRPMSTAATESAAEITYRFALTPFFAIQPLAQRIRNPGGGTNTPAASLVGFRLDVVL